MTDERYWRGIDQFNGLDFFTAHETLEDLWHEYRGDDRTFLQALIQIAAGLYHADAKNFKGARSLLSKGLEKLGPYRPSHGKIDVQELVEAVGRSLKRAEDLDRGDAGSFDLSLFPKINKLPDQL